MPSAHEEKGRSPQFKWQVAWIVAALAAASVVGAIWLTNQSAGERAADGQPIILLPQGNSPSATAQPAHDIGGAIADPTLVTSDVLESIRRDSGDLGLQLRNVRMAPGQHKIACGEMARADHSGYRRFVWLGEAATVVDDDRSGRYAMFAPVCDGRGLP